jgi:molybdopterin-guanine dinucleotide biosynthesis protein
VTATATVGIVGRPKGGKTMFLLSLLRSLVARGLRVGHRNAVAAP